MARVLTAEEAAAFDVADVRHRQRCHELTTRSICSSLTIELNRMGYS
jgi:hypothetical protein